MEKRYLVYKLENGLCTNTIVWDGESPHQIDEGFGIEIVPAGSFAGIGWTRISEGVWQEPVEQ